MHVDRGSLLSQEPDAVGSSEPLPSSNFFYHYSPPNLSYLLRSLARAVTYLFDDETSGTLVLNCAVDKGVGVNNFSFLFNRDMSSVTHEGNSTGSATIGFNDDAGEHVSMFQEEETECDAD